MRIRIMLIVFQQRRIPTEGVDVYVRGGELAVHEGRAGGRRRGHRHGRGAVQAGVQTRGRESGLSRREISELTMK